MKKAILFLFVLILAACSIGGKSEYTANLEKWQDANITHYRYSIHIGCFCAFTQDMPLTIEVRDGEVLSITKADRTPVAPDDPQFELFSRYATIDRLFSDLKTNLDGAADEVTVTYDPTYGYPSQVNIDKIKEAVDDELALTVSNFERLE
jgi:hypothetical protein